MEVTLERAERRLTIRLMNEAEEAGYVYDLVQSGRLLVPHKDSLPLPLRGPFLFKVEALPEPLEIQVGRFEPTPTEIVAGCAGVRLLVACPKAVEGVLEELERAWRDVPPISEQEMQETERSSADEFSRVRHMTFPQRVIYATRAGQTGRAVIMQQPSALLLLYLVKNPLITLPELIAIARMPAIDALVAENLVRLMRSNPQLAMSEELKLALATNVKTPGGTALSLLRHLSPKSLRKLVKMDVNTSLKNAGLKLLLDRRD